MFLAQRSIFLIRKQSKREPKPLKRWRLNEETTTNPTSYSTEKERNILAFKLKSFQSFNYWLITAALLGILWETDIRDEPP